MMSRHTHLVLLGAGHAHVEVLRRFARKRRPALRLTLLTREPWTLYSGMLPGIIRGEHRRSAAMIDCAALAASAGARLVVGAAARIDLAARRVAVEGMPDVSYDLLSIDVGGSPAMPPGAGVAVKPIGPFLDRICSTEALLAPDGPIAVIGGGPGGTELALALAARPRAAPGVLVAATPTILPDAPPRARALVEAALRAAGVAVRTGRLATGFATGTLTLNDGSGLAVGAAFWATSVVGPAMLARSGLACDAAGCVRVGRTLRSVSDEHVFAAGDCAAIDGAPRPKAGVWAVRAGAPLHDSLCRAAAGRPLRSWRPQRGALVILGLGHGRAVAWRGRFVLAGRLPWLWKQAIDRRWLARFPLAGTTPRQKAEIARLGERP